MTLPAYLAEVRRLLATELAPETPWSDADIARYHDEGDAPETAVAELVARDAARR